MQANELKTLTTRFEALKSKRESWNSTWADIDRYVCPPKGSNTESTIFDSTAIWCREQLASGLQMMLVSPSLPWFGIQATLEGQETRVPQVSDNGFVVSTRPPAQKLWEEDLTWTLQEVFKNPDTNFSNQVHSFFLNLVSHGTAIFYTEEAEEKKDIFFRNIDFRECYLEENARGQVETVYRLFTLPSFLAAQQWPDDSVFQKAVIDNPDDLVEILHVVRKSPDKKSRISPMPFQSIYIDLGTSREISEKHYSYFPYCVTRWMVSDKDAYGTSPGQHVMADIKMLNALRQGNIRLMHKNLNPPLQVPEDGYHLPLSITPGAINFYRNGTGDRILPLSPLENIQLSYEEQMQCRDAIMKAFYMDILRMGNANKEMTATEVQMRGEEQMRLLGAIVGRIETEFLSPLIRAVYHILKKYQIVSPLLINNHEVKDQEVKIEYISPLSRASKSVSYNSVEAILGFLQRSGIPQVNPEIYDNLNWDRVLRLFVDWKGVPEILLETEETVINKRQVRAQQIQEMQALQGAQQ